MYLLIITVTAQFSLKCATWLLIKCLFMHSAKLICCVASLSTLQLNLWNMKLDQHGIAFVNKICRKGIKVYTLSIKRRDSISIKVWLCKYREESMKCAIWAMSCAKLFSNYTALSLSLSDTPQNWIKNQEQIDTCPCEKRNFFQSCFFPPEILLGKYWHNEIDKVVSKYMYN